MPRFYFPIIDGTRLDDHSGIDFPDAEAAFKHAHLIALYMPTNHSRHVAVLDADGNELHKVHVGKSP